jgi:hypothetical protein
MLRKSLAALFAASLVLGSDFAFAGPPFATDDPEPTDYQHFETYLAFVQTRTASGTEGNLPQLEINYGGAPDLQLSIALPLAFSRPAGGNNQHGIGDIELGAKYRFLQETDQRPMAAFYPSVTLATGDAGKGLGTGATQILLPLWLQKSWGAWQSYGGVGYTIDHRTGARNHWFVGWQAQRDISAQLTLGGELFYNSEEETGEGSSTGFNLGGMYHFNEHHHLVFSAGRGLSNARLTNQFSSYLAYELTW